MNKASGGDGIPAELLKILKDDAMQVLHSICQQIWKTQQWPQDWKRSFSFQSQRKVMSKMLKLPHICTCLTQSWRKPGAQAGRSHEGAGGVWGHGQRHEETYRDGVTGDVWHLHQFS